MQALKNLLQPVGEFQSRLILTLFYALVMPLFAVAARLAGDALGLKQFHAKQSCWVKRKQQAHDFDEAKRQY
jgi:hypothetical protein